MPFLPTAYRRAEGHSGTASNIIVSFSSLEGFVELELTFMKNDTSREIEFLRLTASGRFSNEIAMKLIDSATERMKKKYPDFSFDLSLAKELRLSKEITTYYKSFIQLKKPVKFV